MMGFRRETSVLNDLLAGGEDYRGILVGPRHSQIVRGVVRELLGFGLSPAEVIPLVLLVVDLIQTIGPSVPAITDEIVRRRAVRP